MLNLVVGLMRDEGEVVIAGELLDGKDEKRAGVMRRQHVGIVFQFFNLLEGMTGVGERRHAGRDRRGEA